MDFFVRFRTDTAQPIRIELEQAFVQVVAQRLASSGNGEARLVQFTVVGSYDAERAEFQSVEQATRARRESEIDVGCALSNGLKRLPAVTIGANLRIGETFTDQPLQSVALFDRHDCLPHAATRNRREIGGSRNQDRLVVGIRDGESQAAIVIRGTRYVSQNVDVARARRVDHLGHRGISARVEPDIRPGEFAQYVDAHAGRCAAHDRRGGIRRGGEHTDRDDRIVLQRTSGIERAARVGMRKETRREQDRQKQKPGPEAR